MTDWAHCRFALRLPRDIFGKAELKPFGVKQSLTIEASEDHWILDWSREDSENYDRFAEDDGRGWMGRLLPLRDELIRGDQEQRAAVLATLEALAPDAPRVLLSTGKLVGEGFDHPPLDTLILA